MKYRCAVKYGAEDHRKHWVQAGIPYGECLCGCGELTTLAEQTARSRNHVKGEPTRFLLGHHRRGAGRPVVQRFWEHVDRRGDNECWPWLGDLNAGYGRIWVDQQQKLAPAHRFSYELHCGPIPDGLVVDHICHNRDATCPGGECAHRACVNPSHLEPTTSAENFRRGVPSPSRVNAAKTHCLLGHELSGENLSIGADGKRYCRECRRRRGREAYARRREDS